MVLTQWEIVYGMWGLKSMTCDTCGLEWEATCNCHNNEQDNRLDRMELVLQDIIRRLEWMESLKEENDL